MAPTYFDPVTMSATGLQYMLEQGLISSAQIVEQYLDQIERHNRAGLQLNALISVRPKENVMKFARYCDLERSRGRTRGSLHGIPIILKDIFITAGMGMPTTCGSHAFRACKYQKETGKHKNAIVVRRLEKAGMIILGKANLTEFCGMKQSNPTVPGFLTPGWSSVGGQTQSAYVEGGIKEGYPMLSHSSAGGSSSGSAVAVAAGFAPLALGSETVGSLVLPATRSGLYSLKIGREQDVPLDGVFTISKSFDCVGGMAKTSGDLIPLVKILTGKDPLPRETAQSLKIGFVDPAKWKLDSCEDSQTASEQIASMFLAAGQKLQQAGADVTFFVDVLAPSEIQVEGNSPFHTVSFSEFGHQFQEFVRWFDPSDCKIRNLGDMVAWNNANASIALPPPYTHQTDLTSSLRYKHPKKTIADVLAKTRRLGGAEGIDAALKKYDLDIIIAPGDSAICTLAAAAGYPIATAPLGTLEVEGLPKRPLGICVVAGGALTRKNKSKSKRKAKGRGRFMKRAQEALLAFQEIWEELGFERATPLAALNA